MKLFFLSFLFTLFSLATAISQTNPLQESMKRGREIYTDFCAQCHLTTGLGQDGIYPPLANSDYLMTNREASIHGIKFGQQGEIVVNGKIYNNIMSPLGLTDDEVADVMNYITNSWGNANDKMITIEEVSKIKK